MKTKFNTVLRMDDPDFAEKFTRAVGLKKGDILQITTPQFDRTDGLQVHLPDIDFTALPMMSEATLKAMGCQKWEESGILWLFPAEWYDYIPEGLIVHSINGKSYPFERGKTSSDRRFGALAYGFKREVDNF